MTFMCNDKYQNGLQRIYFIWHHVRSTECSKKAALDDFQFCWKIQELIIGHRWLIIGQIWDPPWLGWNQFYWRSIHILQADRFNAGQFRSSSPVWNTCYILLLSALYKSSWILALVSKVHWSGLIDEKHNCCLPDMNRMSRLKRIQSILDWYVVGFSLLGKSIVELKF